MFFFVVVAGREYRNDQVKHTSQKVPVTVSQSCSALAPVDTQVTAINLSNSVVNYSFIRSINFKAHPCKSDLYMKNL